MLTPTPVEDILAQYRRKGLPVVVIKSEPFQRIFTEFCDAHEDVIRQRPKHCFDNLFAEFVSTHQDLKEMTLAQFQYQMNKYIASRDTQTQQEMKNYPSKQRINVLRDFIRQHMNDLDFRTKKLNVQHQLANSYMREHHLPEINYSIYWKYQKQVLEEQTHQA